jgi:hypothetical protein
MENIHLALQNIFVNITPEISSFIDNVIRVIGNRSPRVTQQDIDAIVDLIYKLIQKNSEGNSGNVKGSSGLTHITEKVIHLADITLELEESCRNLQETLLPFLKDAQPGETVEIVKFKKVIKNRDLDNEETKWVLEVRSHPECTRNFRNVEIWDIANNSLVAKILLIEPKVTVKVVVNDTDFLPLGYLSARIGNEIISKPYLIPRIKVSVSKFETKAQVSLENLFNEEITNFSLNFNGIIHENLNLEGNKDEQISIDFDGGLVVAYAFQDQVIISNTFHEEPKIKPVIPDPSTIIQETKESIILSIQSRFNELSTQFLENFIAQYPNYNTESLIQQLYMDRVVNS